MASKSVTGVAVALQQLSGEIVQEAVDRFDVIAKESASRVVGGGATMRMHTRRGRVSVAMSTSAKVTDNGDSATAFVNGKPAAQWVWIETGTEPHAVGRRGGFVKGSGYAHPMRAPLAHPGARGQQAWTRAVNEFQAEYPDIAVAILKKKVG